MFEYNWFRLTIALPFEITEFNTFDKCTLASINEEHTETLDTDVNSSASAGRMCITFKISLRDECNRTTEFRVLCALVYDSAVLCGRQASHLCGHSSCLNFLHSYPGIAEINLNREKCFRETATNCDQLPACILNNSKLDDNSSENNKVVTTNVHTDGHNLEVPEYRE